MDGIDISPGFMPLLDRDCISFYLNQTPKLVNHSSYILKVEKDWQNRLGYSDDLLVNLIEKSDTLMNSKH